MSGNLVHRRREEGIVLLSVIIILLTISLVGVSLVAFFSSVNMSARAIADEAKALYLAEAGIARAVYLLRTQAGTEETVAGNIGPVNLGEGAYNVKIDFSQSLITSTGEVGKISKTLQLQYKAL